MMSARRTMTGDREHSRRRVRTGIAGATIAAAMVFVPATASAAPDLPTAPTTLAPDPQALGSVPLDHELAEAVKALKAAGVDQLALKAAEAVKSSLGQLSTADIESKLNTLSVALGGSSASREVSATATPAAGSDIESVLKTLGIQPFSPAIAPFCATPTDDNPLGIVTAAAGAAPGPWPIRSEQMKAVEPLAPLLTLIPGITLPKKLNLVDKGETAFAFVPTTVGTATTDDGQMQVAWFNASTLQGGFEKLTAVDPRTKALLPLLSGVRLAPVKTGSGTILAAIYGTSSNAGHSCFFLPAVGVVNAK
ncbi:hypothetical protein [Gordonia aichiensis]|uniref:Secreted protein n=1 Tax=Gordonia aichiensis NBRC 108223 TaxID=1220583 RepID=L7KIN6_9ACTN|nr:hypothetical protein GOACH_03_05810 [Gordonia aichiensis NBRC 108223]